MTDKPIIFSAPMVRALLDGRKTQTRRILKPQPVVTRHAGPEWHEEWIEWRPPYAIGDRLWVREAWRPTYSAEGWREDLGRVATPKDFDPKTTAIEYLATDEGELNGKDRPSIHMPRWASRITLTVTNVRVQRLQDISESDAIAEGALEAIEVGYIGSMACDQARQAYAELWDHLHGAGAWALNPWVASYTFAVERRNIDAAP
jgi:hypothetical protein